MIILNININRIIIITLHMFLSVLLNCTKKEKYQWKFNIPVYYLNGHFPGEVLKHHPNDGTLGTLDQQPWLQLPLDDCATDVAEIVVLEHAVVAVAVVVAAVVADDDVAKMQTQSLLKHHVDAS